VVKNVIKRYFGGRVCIMRVYILEDHPMVLQGLRTVLENAFDDVTIVEERILESATKNIGFAQYDLAIVDLNISGKRTFDFLKQASNENKNSKHLVFTSSVRQDYFEKAFECNADGYLVKECMPEDLIYAVKTVLKGRRFIDPIFHDIQMSSAQKSNVELLTEREKDVLRLIGAGMSNQKIAENLFITVSTVKKYVSKIMSKMEFENRTEAALFCQQNYV